MATVNLCIDIGNTRTKAALFEGDRQIAYFPEFDVTELKRLHDEYKPLIKLSKSGKDYELECSLKELGEYHLLSHQEALPITLDYNSPETLGTDRIASAIGTYHAYPNKNSLIIDLGTCLTIDLIDSKGVFRGGLISPGVQMRFRAMNEFTAALPLVEFNNNVTFPGKTTEESMQVGVYQSIVYEIKGYIDSQMEQYGELKVVDCSGMNLNFDKVLNYKIFAHPKMVLKGLNVLLNHNA
ncbi:MAG: type III pantothenate kinase [Bacteroidia bacterium]